MIAYAEVIGDPIAQSKSPLIHNFWLKKIGISAEYRACLVQSAGMADYFANRRADPHWRGCNVTMPHKLTILPLLDALSPQAAAIGAVNSVVRGQDGTLTGHNTDAPGFLEPLRAELAQTHYYRMARVLGTGGAARAIVSALAGAGFTIVLAGRDPAKARAMLDALAPKGEHHPVSLDHFASPTDFVFDDREGCLDLVVNASPLGMAGQPPLAYDLSHTPPGAIIYDIVTHPLETPLLAEARGRGLRCIDGLSMLIGQAAYAFTLFFGVEPPRDDDDRALRALLAG